jgi:Bacterial antitoxin of type II TA system, VapB
MRTTIDLSDSLMARVKRLMAKRKTTMRALVEEGLYLLLEEEQSRAAFKLRDASFKGERGFADGAGPEDIPRVLQEINDVAPLRRP